MKILIDIENGISMSRLQELHEIVNRWTDVKARVQLCYTKENIPVDFVDFEICTHKDLGK